MSSLHKLIIFYIAILILLKSKVTKCDGDEEGDSLIQETCKRTPRYELCVRYLESKPESSESDMKGLARIMVDIVLSEATETLEMIREMIKKGDPNEEANFQKCLAYCAELYIPVVKYSLPQAIDALSGGHFGFANYGISDVAKQANACDKAIANSAASSLSDRNALLNDLSLVATAIVNVLLKGGG